MAFQLKIKSSNKFQMQWHIRVLFQENLFSYSVGGNALQGECFYKRDGI